MVSENYICTVSTDIDEHNFVDDEDSSSIDDDGMELELLNN